MKVVIGCILFVTLLPALWLTVVFNVKFRTCIRLENGANLGYEAVFDLSRPLFRPIAVPKLPDGTPIVRDELWSIKVTDTAIYGLSMAVGERGYWFAWHSDTGLVLGNDQPAQYEALVAEAGPANWDIDINNVGTGWLLDELIKRPGFDVYRCPTALLTW